MIKIIKKNFENFTVFVDKKIKYKYNFIRNRNLNYIDVKGKTRVI